MVTASIHFEEFCIHCFAFFRSKIIENLAVVNYDTTNLVRYPVLSGMVGRRLTLKHSTWHHMTGDFHIIILKNEMGTLAA
jgi:hypothetical protein